MYANLSLGPMVRNNDSLYVFLEKGSNLLLALSLSPLLSPHSHTAIPKQKPSTDLVVSWR